VEAQSAFWWWWW